MPGCVFLHLTSTHGSRPQWAGIPGGSGTPEAILYLEVGPERRPPHRRGVSDRRGAGQARSGGLVVVRGQLVRRQPRSLPVGRRGASKDFRRRQVIVEACVIVQHLFSRAGATTGGMTAVLRVPLPHTALRSCGQGESRLASQRLAAPSTRTWGPRVVPEMHTPSHALPTRGSGGQLTRTPSLWGSKETAFPSIIPRAITWCHFGFIMFSKAEVTHLPHSSLANQSWVVLEGRAWKGLECGQGLRTEAWTPPRGRLRSGEKALRASEAS